MRTTVCQPFTSYPVPTRADSGWQVLQVASTVCFALSSDELPWAHAGSAQQNRIGVKYWSDRFDMGPLWSGNDVFLLAQSTANPARSPASVAASQRGL